ncbi:unnamed protein product [Cladocopium goreaui]|uniref:ABC transporter F family member 3 n=1 Tax=Cladocopium goreaui TaxID=2562237 RepID=A0A9P1G831_9DINO|nr:unnamed protein product [Cladocopium goreaui]
MPDGAMLASLLRELAPNAEDSVISYLTTALADANSKEDVRECCEGWLEEAEADGGLERLCEALHLGSSKSAASAFAVLTPSLVTPLSLGYPSEELEAEPTEENGAGTKAKAKPRTKKKNKNDAKAETRTEVPLESLVEVKARVSRFHREAVEDEISSAVAEVDVHDLCISVAGRDLLKDAHLKLCPGQRYGFVGRNGSGKSTLFRSMASGRIPGYPANCVTLLVDQEDVGDERTAVETVVSAHKELQELLEEEISLALVHSGSAVDAVKALRKHEHLLAKRSLFKAAMYESKLSGLRGKAAREALLEAEAQEKKAAEALEAEVQAEEGTAAVQAKVVEILADIRDRLRILGADSMKGRAEVILKGLGFEEIDLQKPTRLLSGGWRMRVALAKALLAKPNVLLLDEPTNHLDWQAILWLEKYLVSEELNEVALVVVSHDRDFLDKVSTMTLRLFEMKLQVHSGNYSTFEDAHERDQQHRAELAQRQHDKQDKMEKQVKEMEQRGRKTNNENLLKAVASRRTKLGLDDKPWSFNRVGLERAGGHKFKFSYNTVGAAMEQLQVENKEQAVRLKLKAAGALGFEAALLQCRDVVVGYDKLAPLIKKFDLDIRAQSRIGILGVNGSGKTTLLRTLVGELACLSGEVYQQPRVVVGFFNQHQADDLPNDATPLESLCESHPNLKDHEVRAHLGSFGLGRLAVQPIKSLSGGERSRVALAAATLRAPHVLVLDEPTNHLDLQTVEALGEALKEFEGSVVVTSYDRRLLREVCQDFYSVKDKQLVKVTLESFVRSVR